MLRTERFLPENEPLALAPEALGLAYGAPSVVAPAVDDDGNGRLTIRGPLMNHAHGFFDSYEKIRGRMSALLEGGASRVVMDIDSPGGLAAGCFDCARDLRRMAEEAGAELVAHIGGQGTSAAYALASAASRIGVSSTAQVGSIGVIGGLMDATELLKKVGVNYQIVISGARKGDGHPAKAIDDDALAATQAHIDGLAEEFFELVAEHGWGGSVKALRSLEAGVVLGRDAVRLGLASEVASLSDMTHGAAEAQEGNAMKRSKTLVAFAAALGLDPECSDEALVQEVHNQLVPKAELERERERADAAERQIADAERTAFETKADAAVDRSIKEGKVPPASRAFYRNGITDEASLEAFEAEMKRRSPIVSSEHHVKSDAEDATELTKEDLAFCERHGIDPKHRKAAKARVLRLAGKGA